MKRAKFLAFALSAAIMTMGAGYAAWTETVTINNTVSTGELNVDVMAAPTVTVYSALGVVDSTVANVTTATFDNTLVTGSTAQVTVENLYPGAVIDITVPLQNTGTIPVKLSNEVLAEQVQADVNFEVKNIVIPNTEIAANATGDVTYTIEVLDGAAENAPATTFTIAPEFVQFNQ